MPRAKSKTYRFKKNSGLGRRTKEEAQQVGEYLSQQFPAGKFVPKDIVEAAKPEGSPLHSYFEWNDTLAASRWRLQQARSLINCLIVIEDDGAIPAYESVRIAVSSNKFERTYLSTAQIKSSEDLIDQVLESALKEIRYWRMKWSKYSSYFGRIFLEIEKTEKALTKSIRRKSNAQSKKERSSRGRKPINGRVYTNPAH